MIALRVLWIALLATVLPARVLSADADEHADRRKGWFKPTLVANHSNLCDSFLDRASALFYSTDELEELPRDFNLPQFENVSFSARFLEISTHDQRVYLVNKVLGGCGGACERRELHVSSQAPPTNGSDWWEFLSKLDDAPPPAIDYVVLRSGAGEYFVAMAAAGKVQLYRLQADLRWTLACAVEVAPEDLSAVTIPRVRRALQAVVDLERATEAVRGGAGSCGSLNSHGRRGYDMSNALRLAIYRPWVLANAVVASLPASYDGHLQDWSLGGISEFHAYETFRAQRTESTRGVAAFFREEFSWSNEQALAAAGHAIEAALDSGIAFPSELSFFTPSEALLRRALLEHRPIAEIKQLDVSTDVTAAESDYARPYESVLAVAVDYPQALEWLLERRLGADRPNAFGKTPLMYAAQRDNVASARLLLDHAADVNAATVKPQDDCFYTLSRTNVTPLHYAVRYGSRELIELLIARGARTFIRSISADEYAAKLQTPLEWLETYAAHDAVERNPHMTDADVAALRELLRVPRTDELPKTAAELTTAAEASYAAGNTETAYRLLKQALSADPASERALTDMSLVGLRASRQGEGLAAATKLIAQTTNRKVLAQAWFNVGLACESAASRYLHYDGTYYCTSSPIHPFLRAWLTEPSPARASKLEAVLTAPDARVCDARAAGANYAYLLTSGDDVSGRNRQDALIYVRHPLNVPAAGVDISWRIPSRSELIKPSLVETHTIGSFQLSLLRADVWPAQTLQVHGQQCVCDNKGCTLWKASDLMMKHVEEAIAR